MTHSAHRRFLVFACPLAFSVACSSAGPGDLPVGTSGAAISTSDTVSRAMEWVDARLQYCESAYGQRDYDTSCSSVCWRESNSAWNAYRSDCSGFVTWAWGLPPVGDGGYVTDDFAPYSTSFSHTVTGWSLQPGDALNRNSGGHIVLFKHWDTIGSSAVFMEEPGCSSPTPYAHEFSSGVSISGSDVYIDYEGESFTAIRYDGITHGAPPPPAPVEAPVLGSVVAWGPDRLDVFARRSDASLWHKYWDGSAWSAAESLGGTLGGTLADAPTAVSWGENRLDVFVRGTNSALFHKWWDGSKWGGFENLGDDFVGDPSAVAWQAGRLDVFVRATDNRLHHRYFDGTWSAWESLGATLSGDPVAVSWAEGRLDVFASGPGDELWHEYWDGTKWSGQSLGGKLRGKPSVVAWGPNRLDVFVRGDDNALWHNWWDGNAWGGFQRLGGVLTSDPVAVSWGENRLDVFGRDAKDDLWHTWWDGKEWGAFQSLGGGLETTPAVASWGPNRLDVFARSAKDTLLHDAWTGSTWLGIQDLGGDLR
jgi:hypothetical protein